MMSAQGASVVLFFGLVNAFYVWYAEGNLWDYIGLAITGLLLLVGFTPPWLKLKANVEREVDREMSRLQAKVAGMRQPGVAPADGGASPPRMAAPPGVPPAHPRAPHPQPVKPQPPRAPPHVRPPSPTIP